MPRKESRPTDKPRARRATPRRSPAPTRAGAEKPAKRPGGAAKRAGSPAKPSQGKPPRTWEWLIATVGAPTSAELGRYAIVKPTADLVEWGAQVASQRVLNDLERTCGSIAAALPKLTARQRRLLLGFSPALLRVTVHSGGVLRDLLAQAGATGAGARGGTRRLRRAAEQAYAEGVALRARLVAALEGLGDHDATIAARVADARGHVLDHGSVASSLERLTALSRELLMIEGTSIAEQLRDGGLGPQVFAEAERTAERVRAAGACLGAGHEQGSLSQAAIDRQDGICLTYLWRLGRVFRAACASDPSIAKLVPEARRIGPCEL